MSNSEEKNLRGQRNRKGSAQYYALSILLVFLLVVAAGVAVFFLTGQPPEEEAAPYPEISDILTGQPAEPEGEPSLPADRQTDGDGVTPAREEQPPMDERIEAPGVPGPAAEQPGDGERLEQECTILGNKLYNFFIHIDSEEYMKPFGLQESSQAYFVRLANKLLDNPPVVTRESDDLYTILKNMAHFFRIIGKDNILLIKTILDRERDKIEDVASELYQWITIGTCNHEHFAFSTSLEKVYEYAGFFLNTMGGRSYLFRRDSRSRLLVNYYSILIVAGANEKGLNRHGIDIRQHIPQLIQEIEATNQLIYKENYLDQLYALLEKYQ
jgi:hypothetical protein